MKSIILVLGLVMVLCFSGCFADSRPRQPLSLREREVRAQEKTAESMAETNMLNNILKVGTMPGGFLNRRR
tara:strand:+ start:9434 stop:9646 length:213 start_codon:yes stop_codon:yes gene_type:complete